MKIAVFHNLPPGGAKRMVVEEIKFLSKRHVVEEFKLNMKLSGNRLWRDFNNFVSLEHKHKELAERINANFDLALVHPDKLTQAPFLLKFLTIPSIYYCHELLRIGYEKELEYNGPLLNTFYENATRLVRKKIDAQNARCAQVILTNSVYTKKKIKKAYNRDSSVCYPGVDLNIFRKRNVKRINQLLFVGEETKINGYGLALEIVKKLGFEFNLKVVSGFRLSDEEITKEYSKSLATLCLSINEPFGMVAIESMACQTPVVAVNEGGYKESAIDGKTGFLVKRDAKETVDKIIKLVNDTNLANRMGVEARKHITNKFNWRRHNEVLNKIINNCCSL